MNTSDIDLDLDGAQAMIREEQRQRAWRRRHSVHAPSGHPPAPRIGERRRSSPEPAWD